MTAYARSQAENKDFKVLCEIKGVNSRYLDTKFFIPSKHLSVENDLRKICKSNIVRGRLDVFFRYEDLSKQIISEKQKLAISDLISDMCNTSNQHGIDMSLSAGDMLKLLKYVSENSFEIDQEIEIQYEVYKSALTEALKAFVKMRLSEGEAIKSELLKLSDKALEIVKKVDQRTPSVEDLFSDKLEKVSKLLEGKNINDLSILNEVALIADKSDVREEIMRFTTHINKFKKMLSSNDAVGKKLDFLAQEMHREVNTLGSKTQVLEVSGLVVELKSIIEQIREQVQNVE